MRLCPPTGRLKNGPLKTAGCQARLFWQPTTDNRQPSQIGEGVPQLVSFWWALYMFKARFHAPSESPSGRCTAHIPRGLQKQQHCLRIPEIFLSPHLFLLKHHSRRICKKIWKIEALCKAALVFIGWAYTFNSLLGGWVIPMAGKKKTHLTDWMFLAASSTKRTFWGATPDLASKAWFLIWICPLVQEMKAWGLHNCIRGVVFHLPPNAAACIRLVDSTFQKAWMHQGRQGDEYVDLSVLVWSHEGAKASNVFKKFTNAKLRIHHKLIQSLYSRLKKFDKI